MRPEAPGVYSCIRNRTDTVFWVCQQGMDWFNVDKRPRAETLSKQHISKEFVVLDVSQSCGSNNLVKDREGRLLTTRPPGCSGLLLSPTALLSSCGQSMVNHFGIFIISLENPGKGWNQVIINHRAYSYHLYTIYIQHVRLEIYAHSLVA